MASLITKNTENSGNFDPQISQKKQEFYKWANDLRETTAMRLKATGRGGAGGGVQWWARLPESFRIFLLSAIAVDDWERYDGVQWDALPEGLRSAIATECRAIERFSGGCPWW